MAAQIHRQNNLSARPDSGFLPVARCVCYAPVMQRSFEDGFAVVQSLVKDFEANEVFPCFFRANLGLIQKVFPC